MILLDTNVIAEVAKKEPNKAVVTWLDALDPDDVYLSIITIGEIHKGVEKIPNCARKISLRAWLSVDLAVRFSGRILPMDTAVMSTWGELAARLDKIGRTLPAIDSLLAAQALTFRFSLATRNVKDFEDTGVIVINPWAIGT